MHIEIVSPAPQRFLDGTLVKELLVIFLGDPKIRNAWLLHRNVEIVRILSNRVHNLIPRFTGHRPEEDQHGHPDIIEIRVVVMHVSLVDWHEHVQPHDAEHEKKQRENPEDVHELGNREDEAYEEFVQTFEESQKAEEARDAEQAHPRHDRADGPDLQHVLDEDASHRGHHADEVEVVPAVLEIRSSQNVDLDHGLKQEDRSEAPIDHL